MKTTALYVAAAFATLVLVPAALNQPLLVLAIVGVFGAVVLRRRPTAALVVWLASLLFVPAWIGVDLGGIVPPATLAAVMLLPALIRARRSVKVHPLDVVITVAFALLFAAMLFAGAPGSSVRGTLMTLIPAYVVLRVLSAEIGIERAGRVFAVMATITAGWSIAEFLTGIHPFETLASTANWNDIQIRGGLARSEGALGHSIVMGGVLASAVPFALTMRARVGWKLAATALLLVGTLVTFSRGAIIAALLGLVLTLVLSPGRNLSALARGTITIGLLTLAVFVAPQVLSVFDASEAETSASSLYRENVLAVFANDVSVFGLGRGIAQDQTGLVYQGFNSIDNAYVLWLLQYGWIPTVLIFAASIMVAVGSFGWRSGAAGVSLIGLLVLASTVALILQLGPILFAVTALGVTAYAGGRRQLNNRPQATAAARQMPAITSPTGFTATPAD
ncbi:O-antigen ligase family protein [Microbacterium sp. NPDC090007]|uniref:O-antigen ligase family protein n=1 Tax=Microbacterium sp. NPDC090007 TaxID=3364204 RepID=UPI0037F68DFE